LFYFILLNYINICWKKLFGTVLTGVRKIYKRVRYINSSSVPILPRIPLSFEKYFTFAWWSVTFKYAMWDSLPSWARDQLLEGNSLSILPRGNQWIGSQKIPASIEVPHNKLAFRWEYSVVVSIKSSWCNRCWEEDEDYTLGN